MKTIHPILYAFVLAGVWAIGLALAADGPANVPVSDDNKTYALAPKIKSNEKVPLVWKCCEILKDSRNPAVGPVKLSDVNAAVEMDLAVGDVKAEQIAAELAVKRIYGRAQICDVAGAFDTDNPATVRCNGTTTYIARLVEFPGQAMLHPNWRLAKYTPHPKLLDALADSLKDFKDKDDRAKTVKDWVMNLADQPFCYLPAAPVKIGETWTARKQVFYIGWSGLPETMDEVSECKLLMIDSRPEGRIAKIEVSGKATIPGKERRSELAEYDAFGAVRVNLDSGAVRWRVQFVSRVKDANDASDIVCDTIINEAMSGQEALAAASQPCTCPTTGPATKP